MSAGPGRRPGQVTGQATGSATHGKIGFGGGCHWCTEAVFQAVAGVRRVEQGFIASQPPHARYCEAVIVHYDPARITLQALVRAHLHTHASTAAHGMRHKYRSAIYTFDTAQATGARQALARLQAEFDTPLVTRVLAFADFQASDSSYRDYYARGPERPFCRTYIRPKLDRLARLQGADESEPKLC